MNDLVRIIATYTNAPSTYNLLAISPDLSRDVYGQSIWRAKSLVDNRGLVVGDTVIGKMWLNLYKVTLNGNGNINRYGNANRDITARGIHLYVEYEVKIVRWKKLRTERRKFIQYADGYIHVIVFNRHRERTRYPLPLIATTHLFNDSRNVCFVTERGTAYSFSTRTEKIRRIRSTETAVSPATRNDEILCRDGSIRNHHDYMPYPRFIVVSTNNYNLILLNDGRMYDRFTYRPNPLNDCIGFIDARPVDRYLKPLVN